MDTLKTIARIRTDYPDKFGIPRQSGLVPEARGRIVFEPEYRDANALRGLEGFSHIWILWGFSLIPESGWQPMVKPPKLGGNTRMGVFATRSPFRPNPIGLSCVRLDEIRSVPGEGSVLIVSGADLADGTPIYDIKPYLPFTDSHPDASGGFADAHADERIPVEFPEDLLRLVPERLRPALLGTLSLDPRPAYQSDPDLPYGLRFAGLDIRFHVRDGVLTVFSVVPSGTEPVK